MLRRNDKLFIDAGTLLDDAFTLGAGIFASGFRPGFIVGVWRGGSPVGVAVQELFEFCGVPSDHIAIRTSSYRGIDRRRNEIRVHGLDYIVENANHDDGLLLVDDVWDSGRSLQAIRSHLGTRSRRNTPADIRTATVYFKTGRNQVEGRPDYFVHETNQWIVFPHELEGLTEDEMHTHKAGAVRALERFGIGI